jgi:Spy/CpxP family protein refolding chaperone
MKHFMPAALAAALIMLPIGAVAGEPSAPMPPGGPMPPGMMSQVQLTPSQQQAWRQLMDQTHRQLEQLHQQVRAKVLGSITPAHRSLLAQVVGSLAISPNPNSDAAVKQIDAALSPAEAQAVIAAHTQGMQQMQALMLSMHQRFQSLLTPSQRAQQTDVMYHSMHGSHDNDMERLTAGDILLHLSGMEGEDHGPMMIQFAHPM